MATQQLARRQRIGFLPQSKASNHWSAPQLYSANFKTLNYDTGSLVNPGVSVEQFNTSSAYGLHEETERSFVDKYADLPTLPFSGKAVKSLLAAHVVAAMQAVSEGGTTPYAKSATSGFLGNGIDFANNEGFLNTIAIENFNDALYTQGGLLKNALLNDFAFEVMANNKGIARLADISGTWIGSEYVEQASDTPFSGTWVAKPTSGYFNQASKFTLKITTTNLSNTDIPYMRFAVKMSNNIAPSYKGAGGLPGNFVASPKWTVEIDLPYFANNNTSSLQTPKLMKSFLDGDNIAIEFETGSAGSDGHLKFAIPYAKANQAPIVVDGEYFGTRLVLDMLSNAGATPMTVTMSDAVDWGY